MALLKSMALLKKMTLLKRCAMLFAAAVIFSGVSSASAHACDINSECRIGTRYYRIRMPQGHDGKALIGALVFAHGYGGTAKQIIRNKGLIELTDRLDIALIAPKSAGRDWTIPGAPQHSTVAGVDELAYFDRVIADAARRFPIDTTKLLAAGFSAGGMMIWNLACHRSESFAGFAPIAGTFWWPEPQRCTTPPANIVHMHGTSDRIVPLEGRRIAETRQGSVTHAIAMYTAYGQFGSASNVMARNLTCTRRVNKAGRFLEFCTFPGGHSYNPRHIARAWRLMIVGGQN